MSYTEIICVAIQHVGYQVFCMRNAYAFSSATCECAIIYPRFPGGKPISADKKANLLHLCQFLPQQLHPFYQGLPADDDDDDEDGAENLNSGCELYRDAEA